MERGVLHVYRDEWPANPFFNLAFEEAFYRKAEVPSLRVWRNDRVVVIGRFQCAALEVNATEARAARVSLVRRFTGGGAVYHDLGNLNYSLVVPRSLASSIPVAFRLAARVVVRALGMLGVEGAYYRPLNDIEHNGLKISGLAASASGDRILVHGALLVSSDLSILSRVLKVSHEKLSDKSFVSSRRKRVTTLEEVLGTVSTEEVVRALIEAASSVLGLEPSEAEGSTLLNKEAKILYSEKYSKIAWNLRYLVHVRDSIPSEEVEALLAISKPSPA